ncbi:MAG: hypothetical protein ACLR78_14020 [Roseburia sp.]
MLKVLDVLDFLDNGSLEKEIMEYKYLDGKTWDAIPDIANKSRSQCIEYWNRGLNKLLEFGKVQALLEEYKRCRKMKNRTQPDSRVCYSMSMKKQRERRCAKACLRSLFTPREQEAEAVHTRRGRKKWQTDVL